MPQKPIQWPCIRNPPSGYASETHLVTHPMIKCFSMAIFCKVLAFWAMPQKSFSCQIFEYEIFWCLSKIASIRCLVLLNQYDGPSLLRQRKSQVLIFKKHKNNCYILKIICFRPFCSNVYVCCVQCLGNVVVWWCAGNIALYRWESWLDVWGNVARAADCRPVPTAAPAMRAWWLVTEDEDKFCVIDGVLFTSSS